jgi:hypothetical protein
MRIVRFAGLLAFVGSLALAQEAAVTRTSYDISYPNYRYATRVSSIRDVDFENLTVFWRPGDKADRGAKLRNGVFKNRYKNGYEGVNLDLLRFLDQPGDKAQRAVVDLAWQDCGGSCTDVGLVQVFELRSGFPTVVQEIEYDRHAPGTGVSFDSESKILTVTGRSADPSPNCCPKSVEVMRFEWVGNKFLLASSTSVPVDEKR